MATQSLNRLTGLLKSTYSASRLDDETDVALLDRCRAGNDPAAFEQLVRRHGAKVLAACRKVLPGSADVDDVFQATFLVLLQKPRAVRKKEAVGAWLYAVAHRIAVRARDKTSRRRELMKKAAPPMEEILPADLTWREACDVLHEELDKLPEGLRPLILCYLDGLSRDEAAQQLGWSVNEVRGRLERGRSRLRKRLERRGIALSAGLLAVVAGNSATASPPTRLIQFALNATAGRPSAGAAALVHGLSRMSIPSKIALAVGVACIALGIGLWQVPPTVDAREAPKADPPAKEAPAAKPVPAKEPAKAEPLRVRGRLLDADGKPLADVPVRIWSFRTGDKLPDPVATTAADGTFRFDADAKDAVEEARVVVTPTGRPAQWLPLSRFDTEQTLKLPTDDVAFNGRILSLENQPLKGVTVEVVRVSNVSEGDLTAWLEKNVAMRKESYWLNEVGLITLPGNLVANTTKTMSDAEGKYKLTGFGRDRVLTVKVYGPNVQTKFFWVVTRTGGPKEGYIKTEDFNHGVYPPDVRVMLAPSRPLVGTVRDSKTGKPVAGVVVTEMNDHIPKSITDAEGRYRIEGVPKKKHYGFNVSGRRGLPYFDHSTFGVADVAGLDELETNLNIDRGLELTGRIVDKAGRPVRASVYYSPLDSNPNAKADAQRVISGDGYKTLPDGTFYLTVWPGKGVIDVRANDGSRYAGVDVEKILKGLGVRSRPVGSVHAILAIDADEAKKESLSLTITLEDASIRQGKVFGPDGKEVAGVMAAGLRGGQPAPLKSNDFTVSGMGATSQRLLLFVNDKQTLGAVQAVSGAGSDLVTVKLQPLGSATGAVHTATKEPWAGLTVTAYPLAPQAEKYENLPFETSKNQGLLGMQRAPWWKLTKRTATTDKDGRFRLDGLLPGLEYVVYVSDGDLGEPNTLVTSRSKVTVESGKTHDLGVMAKGSSN